MRTSIRILHLTSTLLLALLPTLARGQTEDPGTLASAPAAGSEVSFDLSWSSAYVWRGITFTDGMVFQPSLTLAREKGLTLNIWGNLDLGDSNDLSGEFQEVDLTLSYSLPLETAWAVEVGFIEYLFPNGVTDGTREIYATIGWEGVVTPTLSFYYDFDEVNGYYASLGLSYVTTVGPVSLELAASAGHAGDDFALASGGTTGGLFDSNLSLSLGRSLGRYDITGFVAYADTLDRASLPAQDVGLYGGFAVSFSP